MKYLKCLLVAVFILYPAGKLYPFDSLGFFRHSETAAVNSVFIDFAPPQLDFDGLLSGGFEFSPLPLEIRLDYVPPLPLPFSAGVFLKTPYPNLKHFGVRLAYHFDIMDPSADLYVFYVHDFGYVRNRLLAKYRDSPVTPRFFDFRAGVRKFFGHGRAVGICVESGFQFKSAVIAVSIKLN